MCKGTPKHGKMLCRVHDVELISREDARQRGLTLGQPSLEGLVCPVSGDLLSPPEDTEDAIDSD